MRRKIIVRPIKLTVIFVTSVIAGISLAPRTGQADSFQSVAYNSATDELIINVLYRGTNPDHQFSLSWGTCVEHENNQHEITAELLDQQAEDKAEKDFKKTVKMSLKEMDCRPAVVTLRTAPRFYYTVMVPARAASPRP